MRRIVLLSLALLLLAFVFIRVGTTRPAATTSSVPHQSPASSTASPAPEPSDRTRDQASQAAQAAARQVPTPGQAASREPPPGPSTAAAPITTNDPSPTLPPPLPTAGQAVPTAPNAPDTTDWSDDEAAREVRARELAERAEAEKRHALEEAERLGFPVQFRNAEGSTVELMKIQDDRPVYYKTRNKEAALSTAASYLRQTAPYSADGAGITVGIWDGGAVRRTHQEFGARVSIKDGTTGSDDHATHVAGTIGASGVSINAKGMAPLAAIDSYDWNSDTAEMTTRGAASSGQAGRIYLSNHSYGYLRGWDYDADNRRRFYGSGTEETAFGQYSSETRDLDILAFNAPYYLIFWAAGNDRTDNPANGEKVYLDSTTRTLTTYSSTNASHPKGDGTYRNGYENIADQALAKNILTIGAVTAATRHATTGAYQSGAAMSSFSCWGPADDGRIKPDVVANGVSVYSSVATSDTAYDTYDGTSMATPNSAGSAALLLDYYFKQFGAYPRAATLKGLIIHTADDLGTAGPDYVYGWGLINAKKAADLILAFQGNPALFSLTEAEVTTAEPADLYNFVWDGASPIRVTLSWTDPAGASTTAANNRTSRLVNDLDLLLTAPDGTTTYSPYVMPFVGDWSSAKLSAAAINGRNDRDNVEMVYLAAPAQSGAYQVRVGLTGALTNGLQRYSLLVSGNAAGSSLVAPVASAATALGATGFTANWSPSTGATGYYLDVATAADFHTGSSATLLTEAFNSATVPSGWSENAMYYNTNARRGTTGYGAGFNATDDWLQTPALQAPQTLNFWMSGSAANAALTLKIQKKIGTGAWTDVATYPNGYFSATWVQQSVSIAETQGNVYLRFWISSRSGNSLYLDDVEILGSGGVSSILPGYDNLFITGQTHRAISGLTSGTTYFYRVRATNGSITTANSNTISATTTSSGPQPPTVATNAVSNITATTASGGGLVSADGGAAVTARGLVWSRASGPTLGVNDGSVGSGSGTGIFTASLTGLTSGTLYFVRAYATNSAGTAYGSDLTFTTSAVGGSTVLDETFSGGALPGGWQSTDNNGSGGLWAFDNPGNRTIYTTTATDGFAILDSDLIGSGKTQDAWLVTPTLNLTGATSVTFAFQHYFRAYGGDTGTVAYSLNNGSTWTVLPDATFTGTDTAHPATFNQDVSPLVAGQSQVKFRWRYTGSYGWYWAVDDVKVTAVSGAAPNAPTVTTASLTDLTANGAIGGGTVTSDGGAAVTARGLVWGANASPTLASNLGSAAAGTGVGSFTAAINGLTPSTLYYVRAYATNSVNTSYGTPVSFTTLTAASGQAIPFAEDFEGATAGLWTVENTNNDTMLWTLGSDPTKARSTSHYFSIQWNTTQAMNDWLFSPGLALTGGATYQVGFWYRVYGSSYPEKLEVKWGAGNTSAAMTSAAIFQRTSLTNTTYAQGTATFSPATSGTYHLGWHGYSAADMYGLILDDLTVTLLAASKGEPTNHVTDFDLSCQPGTDLVGAAWTDAVGGTLPDGYLLAVSTTGYENIPVPADGQSYANDLDLADGTGLLNIAPGVQSASWSGLTTGLTLYARIYPRSNDGASSDYKTATVVPYGSSTVVTADRADLWVDNASSGEGWTTTTTFPWATIIPSGGDHSGENVCFKTNGITNYANDAFYRLTTPAINLTGASQCELVFWMKLVVEDDYDGAFLEYSTDDGATWTQAGSELLTPAYDGLPTPYCSSDITGRSVWLTDRSGWTEVRANLSVLDGRPAARLRFSFGSDCNTNDKGWYLDDFKITGHLTQTALAGLPPPNGITVTSLSETSLQLDWPAVPGATGYRLDVSRDPTFANAVAQPLDASGYVLRQFDSQRDFALPGGSLLNPGDYLIVCRDASQAQFEAYWQTALGSNVMFVDSDGQVLSMNGGETYQLFNGAGQTVDGRSAEPLTEGRTLQRTTASAPAVETGSWTIGPSSAATPGYGLQGAGQAGLVISEYADAPGTGNYVYEFVELYYDGTGGGGSFVPGYQNLAVSGSSFTITGLQPGTFYYLRLRSENEAGSGPASQIASQATQGGQPPAVPALLPASQVSTSGFQVNWQTVNGADGYRLDVSTTSDFASLLPAWSNAGVSGVSQAVDGLAAAQTYFYRLRAVNAAGTSDPSTTGVATTSPGLHAWLLQYFGSDSLILNDSATLWGTAADPDHDAISNLLEYALGVPPLAPGAVPNSGGSTVDRQYATLTFQRNKNSTDVRVEVLAAPALDTPLADWVVLWSSDHPSDTTYQTGYSDQGAVEVRTIRDNQPLGTGPRFLRLRVSQ